MLDLGMAVIDDACDNAAEGEFTSDIVQSCVLTQAIFTKLKITQVFALFFILGIITRIHTNSTMKLVN